MHPSVKELVIVLLITTYISSIVDELYSIMVIQVFVQLLVTTFRTVPTMLSISNNDMIMDMDDYGYVYG